MNLTVDLRDLVAHPAPYGEGDLRAACRQCAARPNMKVLVLALPGAIETVRRLIADLAPEYGAELMHTEQWRWKNDSMMHATTAMPDQGEHPGFDPLPTDDE